MAAIRWITVERTVLVFAPVGRDGALTRELLERASIPAAASATPIDELCTALDGGRLAPSS